MEPTFTTPGKRLVSPGMAVLHRILMRTVRDGDCWIWQGGVKDTGYGAVRVGKAVQMVHRVVYAVWHGELPEWYDVHHSCHNILCVNPEHLSALSRSRNVAENNHERSKCEHRSGRTTRLRGMGDENMGQVVCSACDGRGWTDRAAEDSDIHRETSENGHTSDLGDGAPVPF